MTVIHEFTASHIPLRYHEAVYPGTLKGGKIWGFSAREMVNGMKAYGRRGNRLLIFSFFCLKAGRCAVWEGQQAGARANTVGQYRGNMLGWL